MTGLHCDAQASVPIVRIVLKALLALAAFVVVVVSVCLCWFYFYSGDLPYFAELAQLAPDSDATVSDHCSGTPIRVIPSASVGQNLRNALRAAEGQSDEILAFQVSRKLFCNSGIRVGMRHLLEYKASVQIRRRFTPEQLVNLSEPSRLRKRFCWGRECVSALLREARF
jgi:hypothetical protein